MACECRDEAEARKVAGAMSLAYNAGVRATLLSVVESFQAEDEGHEDPAGDQSIRQAETM